MQEGFLLAKVIGEYIVSLRWSKGVKQKDLCVLAQISQLTLRRIEKGQVQINVCTLRRIVLALDENMVDFWIKIEKILQVMKKNAR